MDLKRLSGIAAFCAIKTIASQRALRALAKDTVKSGNAKVHRATLMVEGS